MDCWKHLSRKPTSRWVLSYSYFSGSLSYHTETQRRRIIFKKVGRKEMGRLEIGKVALMESKSSLPPSLLFLLLHTDWQYPWMESDKQPDAFLFFLCIWKHLSLSLSLSPNMENAFVNWRNLRSFTCKSAIIPTKRALCWEHACYTASLP